MSPKTKKQGTTTYTKKSVSSPTDGEISKQPNQTLPPTPNDSSKLNDDSVEDSAWSKVDCIGEIPEEYAIKLLHAFDNFWEPLESVLNTFPNIHYLVKFKDRVLKMKKKLEVLDEFRKKENMSTARIISFSHLSWPKLERFIGIDANRVNREALESTIVELRENYSLEDKSGEQRALFTPSNWDHQALKDRLLSHAKSTINQKEAGARMVIDIWINALALYLDEDGVPMVHIPECSIQTSAVRKNPEAAALTIVKYQGNTTALTGVADYAVIAHLDLEKGNDKVRREFKILVGRLNEKKEQGLYTFNDVADLIAKYRLVLVEAKSHTNSTLESHLPQAIGQCIPLVPKRKNVAFVLTNGVEWIFGLVSETALKGDPSDDGPYEVVILPTLAIDAKDIHDPEAEKAGPGETSPTTYKLFLETLLAWIKIDPSQIRDVISPKMRNGTTEKMGSKAKLRK